MLSRLAESDAGSLQLGELNYADIRDTIRAAARIDEGGGNLAPQLDAWRSYLKRFKNDGSELTAEIDRTLTSPGAR